MYLYNVCINSAHSSFTAGASKQKLNQSFSSQYFDDAFTWIQLGVRPIGNKHTPRDKSCAKHKTPFKHSNRRLTKVQYSNTESLKQATPEHVVNHVIAALRRRHLTHSAQSPHMATALKTQSQKSLTGRSCQKRNYGKTTARILPLGLSRYKSASILLSCITVWLVYACHSQHHVCRLEHLNQISYEVWKKYGPTMQCNSEILYLMFKLSASGSNWCPQPKSPLINRLIKDRAGCSTNGQADIASTHQHLA